MCGCRRWSSSSIRRRFASRIPGLRDVHSDYLFVLNHAKAVMISIGMLGVLVSGIYRHCLRSCNICSSVIFQLCGFGVSFYRGEE